MCSRYDLTSPPEAVRAYFDYLDKPNFPPRDNIRPTEPIAVVLLDAGVQRRFRLIRWGLLPHFVKDSKKKREEKYLFMLLESFLSQINHLNL